MLVRGRDIFDFVVDLIEGYDPAPASRNPASEQIRIAAMHASAIMTPWRRLMLPPSIDLTARGQAGKQPRSQRNQLNPDSQNKLVPV